MTEGFDPNPSLGMLLGEALAWSSEREERRINADAQLISARRICADIAPALDAHPDEVFDRLATIPDNLLSLLHSPEGWSALAEYAAAQLGVAAPRYLPTRH